MGRPGATKRSTCHIHPPHRSEQDRLSLNNGRRGQETAHRTDAPSAIAFGPWSQTLFAESTWQTIGLVGQIDGTLS